MKYHSSWKKLIDESKTLYEMERFVDITPDICPLKKDVFRFLNCDLSHTKYIILGMDPYPSTYIDRGEVKPVATGRAFEVYNIDRWTDKYRQSSLANIFKALCFYKYNKNYSMSELRELEDAGKLSFINIHDWFDTMEENGVIFLNATLTTVIGKVGAHITIWESFMNELISFINDNSSCMWLIWGDMALNRVKGIIKPDRIIYSCHPASRSKNDFIENNCFKKAKGIEWF